jgi:hypothetical protein
VVSVPRAMVAVAALARGGHALLPDFPRGPPPPPPCDTLVTVGVALSRKGRCRLTALDRGGLEKAALTLERRPAEFGQLHGHALSRFETQAAIDPDLRCRVWRGLKKHQSRGPVPCTPGPLAADTFPGPACNGLCPRGVGGVTPIAFAPPRAGRGSCRRPGAQLVRAAAPGQEQEPKVSAAADRGSSSSRTAAPLPREPKEADPVLPRPRKR